MADDQEQQPTAAKDDEAAVALVSDFEREVIDPLGAAFATIEIAIGEFEAKCDRERYTPSGKDPVGLTYADARNFQAAANKVETALRRLAVRYRDDIVAARLEAQERAQEPFNGKERSMLRTAVEVYAGMLGKTADRLVAMNRHKEARSIKSDVGTLSRRIAPLFAEQHELEAEDGPLFAGGKERVTGAMEPVEPKVDPETGEILEPGDETPGAPDDAGDDDGED